MQVRCRGSWCSNLGNLSHAECLQMGEGRGSQLQGPVCAHVPSAAAHFSAGSPAPESLRRGGKRNSPHLRPTLAFAEIIPDCSQVLCDLLELCFQAEQEYHSGRTILYFQENSDQ